MKLYHFTKLLSPISNTKHINCLIGGTLQGNQFYFECLYNIAQSAVTQRMMWPHQTSKALYKSSSKSLSKDKPQAVGRDNGKAQTKPRPDILKHNANNKSKGSNKHKSGQKSRDYNDCIVIEKVVPKQNLFIQNRKRHTASEDKLKKDKQFRRKNNNNDNLSSKKDSKRSTDNQNEETLIERLRAENEFYKNAFLASKQSLDKLEKFLQDQRQKRSHEKEWFKHQINNLKKQISSEKIQLGHIFTFDSYKNEEVSNMILETENEGSSLVVPNKLAAQIADEIADALSDLSIESK